MEQLSGANPEMLQYSRDLANCWRESGNIEFLAKKYPEALANYERAREIMVRLVRRDERSGEYQNDLAKCFFDLGGARDRMGKLDEAQRSYTQSAEIRKKLVQAEPANLYYRCDLGLTLGNVSVCQLKQNQVGRALETARAAIVELRTAFYGAPRVAMFRKYLSGAYGRLADFSLRAGQIADAVAATRERERLYPADGAHLFSCACLFARAAAASPDNSVQGAGGEERQAYIDLALETLRRAVRAGYKEPERFKESEALAVIRSHPEFAKLLAEMEKQP
jgi:tetratricopeptide (TPR) repeat protein